MADVVNDLSAQIRIDLMSRQGLLTDKISRILQAVQFPVTARYNPAFNYAFFLLMGLGINVLQQTYLLGTATVISRERDEGTWVQFQVLPLARWLIYAGKLLPYFLVGMVQFGLVLLLGAWFGMPMHGSAFLLLLLTGLFLLAITAFACMVSGITGKINSIRFTMVMAMPSFVLSGYTWPLGAMHPAARAIAECLPLTWYLHAFQAITMKGAGWGAVWQDALILVVIAVVCFLLSLPAIAGGRGRLKPVLAGAGSTGNAAGQGRTSNRL
jgi:ABC-2 type transport system permease protein